MQSDLWMRISSNKKITTLLGEPPSVTERRKQLANLIKTLEQSMKVIQRDPDITAAGMDDDELSQEIAAAQRAEHQKRPPQQNPNQ